MAEKIDAVDITDIEYDCFRTMLRDVYTDDLNITEANSIDLLKAEHKYVFEGVLSKCQNYLYQETNIYNSCSIFSWGRHLELSSLTEKTLDFIVDSADDVFKTEGFLKLSNDDLHTLLSREDICAFEDEIIIAAIKWATNKCKQDMIETNGQTIRQALGPVIYTLRIPLLSLEKYSDIVVKSRILSEEEELGLFKYFTMSKKRPSDLGGFDKSSRNRLSLFFFKAEDILKKREVENIHDILKAARSLQKIYIKFCVLGINDIDEVNQRFITTGKLDIEWKDDFLDWNITEYNNMSSLSVQHYSVWRPDIALSNDHSSTGNIHLYEFDVIVFNTGLIKWTPYSIFETKCEINTMYLPFDKQFCEVEFVLWTASAIGLRFRKAEVEVSTLHVRGEWKFVNVDASIINNGSLHKTVFKFNLQSNPGKVILEFVLPAVIIPLMDLMTFCIPCGSGEKISFTTTIFLLPATSSNYILGIYLKPQMGIEACIMVMAALQVRLFHCKNDDKLSKWMLSFCQWSLNHKMKLKIHVTDRRVSMMSLSVYENRKDNSGCKEENNNFTLHNVNFDDVCHQIDIDSFSCKLTTMLAKVVMCFIFFVVDMSSTVDAKGTCPDESKMDSLIKMVKEMQQQCSCTGSQTIVYDKIYTNLGQAYDSSNGKFRAPVNGLYFFACTQISSAGNVHFILMKTAANLAMVTVLYVMQQDQ
ncbi:unnamed protein product [Mytilus edulis]|uniref:C1q domain-containing protein n=1 Tax=Mytilus edulis TaxID=6550 RepID=A0A8S3SVM7_MYTED|nr:unnamed protein product [Mytilus edulis]